jgi:3',5'-cyclic AMP phosphodiesterase CpdA
VRLAFSSDPHVGNANSRPDITAKILDTVNEGGYDAFFLLGDIADMGVPGSDFKTAAGLLSQKLTQVPLVTLMGNHDALVGGEYLYRKIFNPDLYFRIDSGTAHVIALNLLWGEDTFNKKQKDWLIATLASIPASDTTIVISHSFIRASGYVDKESGKDWYDQTSLINDLAPILEKGGVDLVVSGHNHFMEYLEKSGTGTAYAVIGSMGGKPEPERTYTSDWSSWYEGKQFGFLDVDLYDGHMNLTFRDETGKALHSITR